MKTEFSVLNLKFEPKKSFLIAFIQKIKIRILDDYQKDYYFQLKF